MKMKKNILFLLLLFNLCAFSQKSQSVKMNMVSKLPDTISSFTIQNLSFTIQNFSKNSIDISNVPILSFDYKILKRIGSNYMSIDTNCIFLPQPQYPKEGLKMIKLKKNKRITIIYGFPPLCSLYNNGDYKIKFSFVYFIKNKPYSIQTDWYEYNVNTTK